MDKRNLSRPKRWIVERCQQINFGCLTFYVRGGEPDFTQPHHISRTIRLAGGDNGPRPELASTDFELRHEHIALLSQLERLPDGMRVRVKVTHGLPGASIDIEEDHQAA
jgi:hypothetical protein